MLYCQVTDACKLYGNSPITVNLCYALMHNFDMESKIFLTIPPLPRPLCPFRNRNLSPVRQFRICPLGCLCHIPRTWYLRHSSLLPIHRCQSWVGPPTLCFSLRTL